jgi:hypothetical protein
MSFCDMTFAQLLVGVIFPSKEMRPPWKKMCEAISLSRSKLVRRERQRLTESKVTRNALTTTSTETWPINSFFFFLLFC